MEKSKFWKVFKVLSESFGKNFSEDRAIIYWECLKDIPKLEEYLKLALKTYKFFPSIAEIIELSHNPLDAVASWQKVLQIAQNGGLDWQKLSDHEIKCVSSIGGLRIIQDCNDDKLTFVFNNYIKNYNLLNNRKFELNENERFSYLDIHPNSIAYQKHKKLIWKNGALLVGSIDK